jgi:hypothetical protein
VSDSVSGIEGEGGVDTDGQTGNKIDEVTEGEIQLQLF